MSRKFIAILTASVASLSISGHNNAQSAVVNYAGNRPGGSDGVRSNGPDGGVTTDEGLNKVVVRFLTSGLMLTELMEYYGLSRAAPHRLKNPYNIWLEYQHDAKPLRKKQLLAMIEAEREISREYERLPYGVWRGERLKRKLKELIGVEMNDRGGRRSTTYYQNNEDIRVLNGGVNLPKSARELKEEEIAASLAGDRVSTMNLSDGDGNQKNKLVQPVNEKVEIGSAKSEDGVRTRESEITRGGMAKSPIVGGFKGAAY